MLAFLSPPFAVQNHIYYSRSSVASRRGSSPAVTVNPLNKVLKIFWSVQILKLIGQVFTREDGGRLDLFCEALDGKLAGVNVFFQLLGQGLVKQHGKSIAYSAATRSALCENG